MTIQFERLAEDRVRYRGDVWRLIRLRHAGVKRCALTNAPLRKGDLAFAPSDTLTDGRRIDPAAFAPAAFPPKPAAIASLVVGARVRSSSAASSAG